ncbi:hypothetical protein SDC9_194602 [bioreactor metagenome]|uniref:Uncharacterized protein n=1 Tax=bioreactor metagenome TaxID=1076179 RepID=A0A645I882_9ZZZZ
MQTQPVEHIRFEIPCQLLLAGIKPTTDYFDDIRIDDFGQLFQIVLFVHDAMVAVAVEQIFDVRIDDARNAGALDASLRQFIVLLLDFPVKILIDIRTMIGLVSRLLVVNDSFCAAQEFFENEVVVLDLQQRLFDVGLEIG